MTKEMLTNELNKYAKQIILHILRDYQDSLGLENEKRLRDLLSEEFVVLDPEEKPVNDGKVHIFLNKEDLMGLSFEEMEKEIKKNILVREIFRYIITPKIADNKNQLEEVFSENLTEGLVEKYAEDFSGRHDLGTPRVKNEENLELATKLLEGIPKEISKDALFFQYQYPFMLEYYQIGTGKNLFEEYQEGKKIEPDQMILSRNIKASNGFLKGSLVIFACIVLGVFLAYILIR